MYHSTENMSKGPFFDLLKPRLKLTKINLIATRHVVHLVRCSIAIEPKIDGQRAFSVLMLACSHLGEMLISADFTLLIIKHNFAFSCHYLYHF